MSNATDEDLDDQALADAAGEGARAPDWLVHDDVPPPPGDADAMVAAQDLRRELDPGTRDRIVDHVVDAFLGDAPVTASAHVVQLGRRRRWLWALPVLAAAAAAAFLLRLPGERPAAPHVHDQLALVGTTHLRPGVRGDRPAGDLHLAADSNFYLECAPGIRDFKVTSVRAVRGDEVRNLDFKETSADETAIELSVHADLTPGRWAVQCGVSAAEGFAWLDPPAPLVIE